MPATATGRRTRRRQPQSEALFSFCRHCGGHFEPGSTPVEGVCPDCLETRYFRCDACGTHHEAAALMPTADGGSMCPSCAEELTFTCADCCGRYERSRHSHIVERHGRLVCDQCATGYSQCRCCGRYFRNSDIHLTASGRHCWSCAAYEAGHPIQSYGFKPEPVFHDAPGEEPTGLYLGVELEMDYGDAEAAAKRIRSLYGPDLLYVKHDSSLDAGCELVTHPMSPEYMMSEAGRKMWRDVCEAALAEGMRSHDTDTCGMHVHVSRDFFGKSGVAQEITELKLVECVDRLFEPLVLFSRRRRYNINRWAPRCDAPKSEDGWVRKAKLVSEYARRGRYRAVNVTNAHTIEFRLFRGTLRPETILATLQFVSGLCHLAKELNPAQMERICWYDLCDAVMDRCPTGCAELYGYLVERELIVAKGEM